MPSFADLVQEKKQFVTCIEDSKRLLQGKMVKVGDKFAFPTMYESAFSNQDLLGRLSELFSGFGFSVTVNGNNQFEVTGTI